MWDATCVDTLAPSHRVLASTEAGAVANEAKNRKKLKYSHLESTHAFVPVVVETLGTLGREAPFLREVACRIKTSTGDPWSHQFLLQRVAVAVQRGNTASILVSSTVGFDPLLFS